MSNLARHLSGFLNEHLVRERHASRHTCDAYAYCFQLLLTFAAQKLRKRPSKLAIEDLDAYLIIEFLNHLESQRGNSPKTRNLRLVAINSFFKYLEFHEPRYVAQIQHISNIPTKRTDSKLVDYLTKEEAEALLGAPDVSTVIGMRDHAMLLLAISTGLRVSELVSLRMDQCDLGNQPEVRIIGKGRKARVLPLWRETARSIAAWLRVRPESPLTEIFVSTREEPLTRVGFAYAVKKYARVASRKLPSLRTKNVTPHTLRHTCAMHTLLATGDIRKVSLWLGHAGLESTEMYLRADPTKKLEALAARTPIGLAKGKFRPPDKLLALLKQPPARQERLNQRP